MGYNPQQQEAIDSTDRTILCLAGAGAGKTKTLLGRIERLIRDGVDPKSILSLTFTNAAAFEMKERYKQIPGLDLSKGEPEFRTFHSFCYSLIVKDPEVRKRLGYTKIPSLCEENQLKEIKTRIKLQLNCDLTDAQLENDVSLSKKDAAQKMLFKKALIKEIKKQNIITFDIMCYNVCELFEKDDDSIKAYKQKYKYLQVDEAQDSDPKQFRFISSFPETTNFFLCADALQNIYAFRGCTNQFVKVLSNSPDWKVIKLYKNYRSTSQICDYANKFSKYAKDEYRIEMEGQRPGPEVTTVYGSNSSYNQPVDEDHLAELIDMLRSNKTESAILCRSNKECACVRDALTNAGIEFNSSHKSTDVLNYLNGALDNDYLVDWLSSMLDTKEYGDYIRLSSLVDNPDLKWFFSLYGNHAKIKAAGEKIKKIRNIASGDEPSSVKFDKITKMLKIKSKCEFDDSTPVSNRELIEQIRDQMEDYEENKIYVGTIHSSKGLEYDAVYVMGVGDYSFQLGSEEMNNLYYVAITRAKTYLTVFRR